jgi:hypothetical protein
MIYRTEPRNAVVGMFGRRNLPGGRSTSGMPLFDCKTGLLAQLTGDDAVLAAERLGGRLPTRAEVLERFALPDGVVIEPVILPNQAQRKADPRLVGETPRAWEIRIRKAMASRLWAEIHSREVIRRVTEACAKIGGGAIVSNPGKHWIGPGSICGWLWKGRLIQSGLRPVHPGGKHCDYATTTIVIWDEPAP